MMNVELVPIGTLDRRSTTERRLDNLLKRYSKPRLEPADAVAATTELLEAYVAVVRRRSKIPRHVNRAQVIEAALNHLAYITKNVREDIDRRIVEARAFIAKNDREKADQILETLQKQMPELASRNQREISTSKRAPTLMNQIVGGLHKKNSKITSTEVKTALRDMVGQGIVLSMDDQFIEIDETPEGVSVRKTSTYAVSGIPAILSRIKNPKT
jgi:hypothetical protein